jgi:hypothetical protein
MITMKNPSYKEDFLLLNDKSIRYILKLDKIVKIIAEGDCYAKGCRD